MDEVVVVVEVAKIEEAMQVTIGHNVNYGKFGHTVHTCFHLLVTGLN